ncbi:MAG TPA: YfhO family protein [Thermoanaerobaculia bacterium]|nr:YfhO family protein [Thermoanaerobaculia bacterium]
MILLLYAATAAAALVICHRFVRPVSRIAAALLVLLPFCFTGFALVTDRVYAPIDIAYASEPLLPVRAQYGIAGTHNGHLSDVASQMIPWRKAVQVALSRGEWPILNPFILSGDILAAAAQPAAYSPFTLIACLLPVAKSMTYTAAMLFFIAALGAFLFARELGCREAAALIAAAGWMFCSDLTFFTLWPLAFSWAFLPIVLLGVRRVVRDPAPASFALLTAAFTLMLLAGHPETALHVVFLGIVYAVFEMASSRTNVIRAALTGVGAGALALLLCAVYVLPIIEAVPQTEESFVRATYASERRGASAPEVAARVATDFLPFLYVRQWRSGVYVPYDTAAVGSIVMALAIYAIWRVRSRETWFFAGLAIFCILARAEWKPIARALQKLPLFDVAINSRFSFGAAFALALLAAIGVEEFLRRERDLAAAVTAAAVLVILAAGTLLIVRADVVAPNVEKWGDYKIFAEIAGLAVVGMALLFKRPVAVILAAILLQRVISDGGTYKTFPARDAYPPILILEPLRNIREPFRIVGAGMAFVPGMSSLYELEDVRGYEAMTLLRYAETYRLWCIPQPVFFNRVDDLSRPFLSFLNVRYAITPANYVPPSGWHVAGQQRGTHLLENTHVVPRGFVPARVRSYSIDWKALNEMTSETDFATRAWIRWTPGSSRGPTPAEAAAPFEIENGPGRVSVSKRHDGYEIRANMQRGGWVVLSEAAWSGWRAWVDGRRAPVQLANTAFLSVFVPAGQHRVKFVYKPQSFVIGRAITIATLAAIVIAALLRKFRQLLFQ